MPILDLSKMKVESRWHELKRKATEKAKHALQWAKENPELAALAGAGIGAAAKGLKSLVRTYNVRKDQYNKERYIYDRSLGMYLHTKRKLTNKDYATINARRAKGEKLADILASMRILD